MSANRPVKLDPLASMLRLLLLRIPHAAKGIIMLFLGFAIAAQLERSAVAQELGSSGNKAQVSRTGSGADVETAISKLIKAIRSKDFENFFQSCEKIRTAKTFNQSIPVIREALRDLDPDIRFMGLWAFGLMLLQNGDAARVVPEANSLLPEMVALIGDKDLVVRYHAVRHVGAFEEMDDSLAAKAIPALIEFLRYKLTNRDIPRGEFRAIGLLGSYRLYDGIHEVAAEALAKIGPRALPALIKALKNDDALTREGAARSFGEMGPAAKQLTPLLLAATRDRDSGVRFHAAVALWKIDRQVKPALPILIESVQNDDIAVGMIAALIIGQMGSDAKAAVAVLAEVMKADRHIVSSRCALALGKIGPEARAAIPALLEVLKGEDEPPLKLPETIHDRVPPIRPSYLKPKYFFVRFEAAEALWRIDRRHKVVVPVLIELLQDDTDGDVDRPRAAELLGEIGPDAMDAIPELLKATKGKDSSVREAAIKALKRIDPGAK